ncbi:Dipeptide transport system permease protein DppC [subsurface metagenome]
MLKKSNLIEFWGVYKQRKTAVFGLAIVAVFFLAIALAPYIAPYDPSLRIGAAFEPPSWQHLLGTNDIGVDVLSELIYAGRISLMVGLIAASIVVMTGSTVGLISGYFGGVVDEILMRITDIVLILPRFPLMIVMAAYLGPGMWTIIFVYSVVGWASLARQVRSQVLSVKESTFVEASRAIGAGNTHIMISHILPNIGGIIIANGVMEIMFAILTEAGLSFLGLGDPTHKSWGVMLYWAQIRGAFLWGAWWWIFPPGLCISLISCGFNFIGTALNDLFSLKLGKR